MTTESYLITHAYIDRWMILKTINNKQRNDLESDNSQLKYNESRTAIRMYHIFPICFLALNIAQERMPSQIELFILNFNLFC